jgi:hypothetical protein
MALADPITVAASAPTPALNFYVVKQDVMAPNADMMARISIPSSSTIVLERPAIVII